MMKTPEEEESADASIIVALGGNLAPDGALQAQLERAISALPQAGLRVLRRSRLWRSSAWPDASQPPFLNMVAQVQTKLNPEQTLQALHRIEADFGRRRDQPNAPRTVDLDLIAFGRRVRGAAPILPHPRAAERLFVMGPLAEIAPLWRHPISGLSAAQLARSATVGRDARPVVGDADAAEEGE